jgi:hypothetical protein
MWGLHVCPVIYASATWQQFAIADRSSVTIKVIMHTHTQKEEEEKEEVVWIVMNSELVRFRCIS